MPINKDLGNQTYNPLKRTRILGSIQFTLNDNGDTIDLSGTVEKRDSVTNELVSLIPVLKRFSQSDAAVVIAAGAVAGVSNYNQVRNGLLNLAQALVDTNPN